MTKKFNFKPQTSVSLREKVTNDIREVILSGELKPGQRLKESDVADQMGVSRGPVREAIRQLEREGLIVSHPYRETIVADIDLEEVKDVLVPIRFQLEWYVIKKYIHEMDSMFFDGLQEIVEEMKENGLTGNFNSIVENDIRFHEMILEMARERTVKLTWQSIQNQIRLHFNKNSGFYGLQHISSDHQILLDKLRIKQLPDIQSELIRHVRGDESFLCFEKSDHEMEG